MEQQEPEGVSQLTFPTFPRAATYLLSGETRSLDGHEPPVLLRVCVWGVGVGAQGRTMARCWHSRLSPPRLVKPCDLIFFS